VWLCFVFSRSFWFRKWSHLKNTKSMLIVSFALFYLEHPLPNIHQVFAYIPLIFSLKFKNQGIYDICVYIFIGGLLFKMGESNMQYVTSTSFLLLTYAKYLTSARTVAYCGGSVVTPARLRSIAKKQVCFKTNVYWLWYTLDVKIKLDYQVNFQLMHIINVTPSARLQHTNKRIKNLYFIIMIISKNEINFVFC